MIRFNNDYNRGALESILDGLTEINAASYAGYGEDQWCGRAEAVIKKLIAREDAMIKFVPGATQANIVAIAAALSPVQSVIAADTGHINCHEAASIESTGHKILGLPNTNGKLTSRQIAACAAEGTTVIYNAAREPEIETLQSYLCALGADVSGAGSPVIRITGFSPRSHAGLRIPPDRIAAATYLCCTACAGGEIELTAAAPGQIVPVLDALRAMGCAVSTHGERIHMTAHGRPASPGAIVTRPYPGFPTDAAPLLMAASLRCTRPAMFIENIFSGRYRHAEEMRALGAQIVLRGPMALVTGVETLHGASMKSPDLRGGAALVAAALGAEGESTVTDAGHILRGYESLDETLRSLGASVWREKA